MLFKGKHNWYLRFVVNWLNSNEVTISAVSGNQARYIQLARFDKKDLLALTEIRGYQAQVKSIQTLYFYYLFIKYCITRLHKQWTYNVEVCSLFNGK